MKPIRENQLAAYRDFRFKFSIKFLRTGILIGFGSFYFFALLDFILVPNEILTSLGLRLLVLPFFAWSLYLAFRTDRSGMLDFSTSCLIVMGCWVLYLIIALFYEKNPLVFSYYHGIHMIMIFGTILFRKSTKELIGVIISVCIPFQYVVWTYKTTEGILSGPFMMPQFYFWSSVALCFMTAFVVEYFFRDVFGNYIEQEQSKRKADEAVKARSRFLANMSHEIRTPINGIIGMTDILDDTELTQKQKEILQVMRASADGLVYIINDILDFSKIEAGRLEFDNQHFDLQNTLKTTFKIFEVRAQEKGLRFIVKLDHELPTWVFGDETRFKQILSNLLSNAVKFTLKGRVTVSVTKGEEREKELQIGIAVRDTGIGISDTDQSALFQPFHQAASRSFEGTGLGLVIVKSLVERMKGSIDVTSNETEGTVFKVDVWFNKSKREVAVRTDSEPETPTFKGGAFRILLVEDNLVNQRVAHYQLKRLGHEVELAVNGLEAVEKIKASKYDLVFMDIQMPVMDGVTATRLIREYQKKSGEHPVWIVALTANAIKGDRERFLGEGMDDYISKPFTPQHIQQSIHLFASQVNR